MKKILFFLILLFIFSSGSIYGGCNNSLSLDPSLLEELSDEQQDILNEELQNYSASLENQNLSLEQSNAKIKELIYKIRNGLKIYSFARKNEKLQALIKTFEDSTKVRVYIYSYVEGAFLNNLFYRLSEAYYDAVRPNGYVKLKYNFIAVTEGNNPVYNIIPEIEADELVLSKVGRSNNFFVAILGKHFPEGTKYDLLSNTVSEAVFASTGEALEMLYGLKNDASFASQLKLYALDINEILADQVNSGIPGYRNFKIKVAFSKNIKMIKSGHEGVEDFYKAFFNDPYIIQFVSASQASIVLYSSNSYWQSSSSKQYLAYKASDPKTIYEFNVSYGYIYSCLNNISPPGDLNKFKQNLSDNYSGGVLDDFKRMYEISTEGNSKMDEKTIYIDEIIRICDLRKEMGETKWKEIHERFGKVNVVLNTTASYNNYFNTLYYHHKNYLNTEKLLSEILACNTHGRDYMQMTFLARMLPDYEIDALNAQLRVHILKIMSRGKMSEKPIYENEQGEEDIAIKIFRSCNGENIQDFLLGLEAPSSTENKTPVFVNLVNKMNDALGSDYYSEMVKETSRLISDSPDFQERLSAMLLSENLENRIAKWDIDRTINPKIAQSNLGAISFSDVRYDEATGEVSFQPLRLEKDEWWELPEKCDRETNPLCKHTDYTWEQYGARVKLQPMDLILFINYNDKDIFNDPTQKKPQEILFAPAYYLWHYKTEQQLAQSISTAFIAIDLAVIATIPVSFISAATKLRTAFVIFELCATTGNLAANTLQINNPAFIEAVNASNMLMAAIGVRQLLKAGTKINLKDALTFAIKNSSDGIAVIKTRVKNYIEVINKNQQTLQSLGATDKNLMYLVDDLITMKGDLAKKAKEMWGVEWAAVKQVWKLIDGIVDDIELENIAQTVKYLPGPELPLKISATFKNYFYTNRKLLTNERFFKYHGVDNKTGKKYTWVTNKKYAIEKELRENLAIRDDWGVEITNVSEFDIPAGMWISEGRAEAQGIGYPGGDYQAVILNLPKSYIIRTDQAFK